MVLLTYHLQCCQCKAANLARMVGIRQVIQKYRRHQAVGHLPVKKNDKQTYEESRT